MQVKPLSEDFDFLILILKIDLRGEIIADFVLSVDI